MFLSLACLIFKYLIIYLFRYPFIYISTHVTIMRLCIYRQAVLARNLEIQEVESGLRTAAKLVAEETQKVQNNIENVAANEANLEAKIEKKKVEISNTFVGF